MCVKFLKYTFSEFLLITPTVENWEQLIYITLYIIDTCCFKRLCFLLYGLNVTMSKGDLYYIFLFTQYHNKTEQVNGRDAICLTGFYTNGIMEPSTLCFITE